MVLKSKMSAYTIRVELHSSQYTPDFQVLHSAMENEGFSRMIKADTGKIYHLPRGEYSIFTQKDCSQVLESAKRAVKATGHTAEILVTEALRRSWDGLSEKK